MLTAISPIDGRYAAKTAALIPFFSEYALIKYRIKVELLYFQALVDLPLPQLQEVPAQKIGQLLDWAADLEPEALAEVKEIEKTTNHDVKAVEYFIKREFDRIGLGAFKEFVHFGLTSQDINNTATPLLLKAAVEEVYLPLLEELNTDLGQLIAQWQDVPMLARTHGQPASPTRLGKEFAVFLERILVQLGNLQQLEHRAKFGGATGNLNAHFVAYPDQDWHAFADHFVADYLGLKRSHPTTQIEHYDQMAALFHNLQRINTILIDLCRDIWTYISMDYFKQKTVAGEIGSSAMPHKVNPIDFENAEGNLGLANAIFAFLADKLPVSRLQRDLTDSTVLRNIGVPMGHTVIALHSIRKGLSKLLLNPSKIEQDLEDNWMVVAEAIQTVLRREGYEQPYEALKALTRGKALVPKADIHRFIDELQVDPAIREELKRISPQNFIGR